MSDAEGLESSAVDSWAVPRPPISFTDRHEFSCPYCNFDMKWSATDAGQAEEEWEEHVFEDLMTYLCTYDE